MAECCRRTVAEALKVLEWAGVLSWQHRITRVRERCTDLFGREGWRWRVIRTSNAYQFIDPQADRNRGIHSECKNPLETQDQDISKPLQAPAIDPTNPLERALARLGTLLAAKEGIERGAAG
jgi:hypothetical protein